MKSLYPMKLQSRTVEKVWGGRELARVLHRSLPGRAPVGEIWVAWDGLEVKNGPWRNRLLRDLAAKERDVVIGRGIDPTAVDFPLLVKFLDARQNLSIQVHPNDTYARLHEGQPFGKSELWYIVDAAPGSVIYQGLNHALSPGELRASLESGSILEHLAKIEVKMGDVFVNAPGTIHALGAGIVIWELQQSSDLTYRLYDWDRSSTEARRPLHFDQSIDVTDYLPLSVHQIRPVRLSEPGSKRSILGVTPYFMAELWSIDGSERVCGHGDRFELVTVLTGKARIRIDGTSTLVTLAAGATALVPAGVTTYTITSVGAPADVFRSYVPDLWKDVAEPLLAGGVEPGDIVQLGGDPRTSALTTFVPGGVKK